MHVTELTTSNGGSLRDPGSSAIEAAVDALESDSEFLILSRADEEYVQATDSVIEYRHDGRHFQFETGQFDRELLLRVLYSYIADDEKWKTMVEWRDVTDELRRGERVWITVVAVLVAAVAIAVIWNVVR